MNNFTIYSFEIIVAFIFLLWSADRFVVGATIIARYFSISPLIIGFTIVAIGTSAPEMFFSILAAINGHPEIGIGNAIGSNIANIGLVVGITALVDVVHVRASLFEREIPALFFVTVGAIVLLWNYELSVIDGSTLLVSYCIIITWILWQELRKQKNTTTFNAVKCNKNNGNIKLGKGVAWFLVGLILLPLSAHVLVLGASGIARCFGISEFIIGLTVVAIGTSLPELATSVMSTIKGEHDIAIGNVVGSNIANLTIVLGPIGLITPTPLPGSIHRDLCVMGGGTVLLIIMALYKRNIVRLEGIILLLGFVAYLTTLVFVS